MRMPLFFLARHSLELHLKETAKVFAMGREVDLGGHGLAQLWTQLLRLMNDEGYSTDDEYAEHSQAR